LHDKSLVLTAVNPDVRQAVEAQVAIHGGRAKTVTATVLTAPDIHAHNTFEQRAAVLPKTAKPEVGRGGVTFRFPAASVVKLEIELA
jgi:alpha-L-arabinofuranosidase